MLTKVYAALGSAALGLYTAAGLLGWQVGTPSRETPQESTARHATGGHRAAWISSYRGGK